MQNVEVLLRERVDNLGRCGDVVKVKAGFARNYLYPNRLAVPATEENKRMLARRAERMAAEEAALTADLQKRVDALAALTVKTVERADDSGHLYGSVTAARAVELLSAFGYSFDEKDVRMERPLKTVGTHEVRVHLHGDTFGVFQLEVEAEAPAEA